MSDIGPGTELEFIGPLDGNEPEDGRLMIGAIYATRAVIEYEGDPCYRCRSGVFIRLTINNGHIYSPCVFRPIRDGQERIERKAVKRVCEPA